MIEDIEWTAEWPKEPGYYFCYGCIKNVDNKRMKFMLCNTVIAGSGNNKFIAHAAGGMFIYPVEWSLVFSTNPVSVPDQAKKMWEELNNVT